MSDVKWIKIVTDIFDDEKIKMIEALPSADSIIVIWFKLLCLAGQSNNSGVFMMNNKIAYTDEMLAAIFRRDVSTVRLAITTFQNYGMVEVVDDVLTIPNWDKYQTLDAYERKKERDRIYQQERREKQKQLIEDKKTKKSSDESSDIKRPVGRLCSYSYSLSNIKNLDYVLNHSDYKNSIYILNNNKLLESIKEWMEYKDNKNPKTSNHYDTEKGMRKFLTMVVNYDMDYGTDAIVKEIDKAISLNWMGISFDNLDRYGKKIPKRKQQKPKIEEPEEPILTDEEWLKL